MYRSEEHTSELQILADFKILAFQHPEFKILADSRFELSKILNSRFWTISRF